MQRPPRLAVRAEPADDTVLRRAAAQWAKRLNLADLTGLEPVAEANASDETELHLLVTPEGLAVQAVRGPAVLTRGKPVRIDLHRLDTTTGPGRSLRQPMMRAVGLRKGVPHRPSVLDVTAGLGEDAWRLACAGCAVRAVERHPVVAALLEDAVTRARGHWTGEAEPMIEVILGESRTLLEELAARRSAARVSADEQGVVVDVPEVVYIDPMFAPGRKGAERKPMRLLRALVGGDLDADALLAPARRAASGRVVVKRGRRAVPLAGAVPAASHFGRAVRYDIYPAAGMPGQAVKA